MVQPRRVIKPRVASKEEQPIRGAVVPEATISVPKNLKILVYGESDVGKTVFASGIATEPWPPKFGQIVDNVLFGDADGGMVSLASLGIAMVNKYPMDAERLTTLEQLRDIPMTVKKLGSVDTVVIDTMTRLQESLMLPRMNKEYAFEIRDWGFIRNVFMKLAADLSDLNCHLICTAHAAEKEDESKPSIGTEEDPLTKKIRRKYPVVMMPILQGAFKDLVSGYFDVVAYYRLEWKGDEPVRKLYTRPSKKWKARCRLNFLPEVIENPDIPTILDEFQERRLGVIDALSKSGISVRED